MAIQAKLQRENSPDSYDFVLPGNSYGLRRIATRSRKLPVANTTTPVTRGGVKLTYDREIKDSNGDVSRVQPQLVEIDFSIPVGVSLAEVAEVFDSAVGIARSQLAEIASGLLPGQVFEFTPDTTA